MRISGSKCAATANARRTYIPEEERFTGVSINVSITEKAKEELKVMQELVMKLKITGTPKIIVVDKTENKIIESIDGANIELIDKYQKENK